MFSKKLNSDHFDGKRFFNPHNSQKRGLFDVLKWIFTRDKKPWPSRIENNHSYSLPEKPERGSITITFINHATFLIQSKDLTIITDPIFSDRASPFSFIGPKRVRPPAFSLEELPTIDLVLLSHNHYDHLDLPSLQYLNERFSSKIITGLGIKKLLQKANIENVIELDWFESTEQMHSNIVYTPAQHFSSRTLFDRDRTLWGGFAIYLENKKLYFAGDSGYGPHFREIHNKLGSFDLAMIPIGAYEPRWFMKLTHTNPEEAVLVHKDLNAKQSLGMHFGTFQLTDEDMMDPLIKLKEAKEKYNIENFSVLEFGESMKL